MEVPDPRNSTTKAVRDFYSRYRHNSSMINDQFNPFTRESVAPCLSPQ